MSNFAIIVEDDKDTATLFSHILKFVGFETEILGDGDKAMARLAETEPVLVLLDLQLSSDVSGVDVLDHIINDSRLTNTRVIIVTGHPHMAETVQDKVDLVLVKPISPPQLASLVSRMCPQEIGEQFLVSVSHDALTGLSNRAKFKDRLTHAIARTQLIKEFRFAVLILDVLNLEMIRSRFGYATRDEFLVEVVQRLEKRLRQIDTLSRIGENKFAILLENITRIGDVSLVVDRILEELGSPIHIDGLILNVDVNFGIAYSTQPYKTSEDFLQVAEQALVSKLNLI
jgi:two-component system cell cycle response regulator